MNSSDREALFALERACSRGGLFRPDYVPPKTAANMAASSRTEFIALVIRRRTSAGVSGVAKVTALEMFSSVSGKPASWRISTSRMAWLFTAIAVSMSSLSFIRRSLTESICRSKRARR